VEHLSLSPAQDSPGDDLKELDLRLPKVSAALILLSQCLTTICLQAEGAHEAGKQARADPDYDAVAIATQAEGFVETIVGEHQEQLMRIHAYHCTYGTRESTAA
jgi:hypothetical protein